MENTWGCSVCGASTPVKQLLEAVVCLSIFDGCCCHFSTKDALLYEKDDVDESKDKEDAIEKMNETEHWSEETQENDATENEKSETEATQENDGKDYEKNESEDNHNEDDHVKEVDNANEK